MNVKKLCRRKSNANNEADCGGIHFSRVYCLPLSSLSGSAPGNVRWCPSLALGSLFKAASDLCKWLKGLWLYPIVLLFFPVLPCWLSISPGSRCGSFNNQEGRVPSLPISKWGLWWDLYPVRPPRSTVQSSQEDGGSVSPPPHHLSWSVPDSFQ